MNTPTLFPSSGFEDITTPAGDVVPGKKAGNTREHIRLDEKKLAEFAGEFLHGKKFNPFYDRNVFFAPGITSKPTVIYQMVGNLGGWVENGAIDISMDFVIVPDAR